jgi:hypothetical protein
MGHLMIFFLNGSTVKDGSNQNAMSFLNNIGLPVKRKLNKSNYVLVLYCRSVPGSTIIYTAKEKPARIRYKCLVPIYVFPEMTLSPSFHIHVSVSDLYITRICQPTLLQPNRQKLRMVPRCYTIAITCGPKRTCSYNIYTGKFQLNSVLTPIREIRTLVR